MNRDSKRNTAAGFFLFLIPLAFLFFVSVIIMFNKDQIEKIERCKKLPQNFSVKEFAILDLTKENVQVLEVWIDYMKGQRMYKIRTTKNDTLDVYEFELIKNDLAGGIK
jgi:hypothetical protein